MSELNTTTIDTKVFSPADWKRLTDYVAILIVIDRKLRKKSALPEKENTHD